MESTDVQTQVAAFVRAHLLGHEREFDASPPMPLPVFGAFHAAKLSNWWLPERYGGRGLSLEQSVEVATELAYGDAGVAFALYISILSTSAIEIFGTEEQKDRFLRPMVQAGTFSALLGSEFDAGSELLRLSMRAEKDGGEWVLRGEKAFSTNTDFADFLIVIARTSPPEESPEFGAFIVPRDTPGIRIVRRWSMLGVRGSGTYEVSFEGCRIPEALQLPGNGLRILEASLNSSRILIAATAIGIARRTRDLCLEYAAQKQVGGAALTENAVFVSKLGQMEMELEAMRAVCRTAAVEYDGIARSPEARKRFNRVGVLKSAAVAKMFCGQAGWRIASVGSEMFGGLGYTDQSLAGKLLRDARFVSIVEGGDDVLRGLLYARDVLPAFRKRTAG